MPDATILVVDDEPSILSSVTRALSLEGYDVEVAGSAEIALEKVGGQSFDAILLDVQLPGIDGLQLLDELSKREVSIPVIMMSGHGTIEVAMEAIRRGAVDFIEKPIGNDRLVLSVSPVPQAARARGGESGTSSPLRARALHSSEKASR